MYTNTALAAALHNMIIQTVAFVKSQHFTTTEHVDKYACGVIGDEDVKVFPGRIMGDDNCLFHPRHSRLQSTLVVIHVPAIASNAVHSTYKRKFHCLWLLCNIRSYFDASEAIFDNMGCEVI